MGMNSIWAASKVVPFLHIWAQIKFLKMHTGIPALPPSLPPLLSRHACLPVHSICRHLGKVGAKIESIQFRANVAVIEKKLLNLAGVAKHRGMALIALQVCMRPG